MIDKIGWAGYLLIAVTGVSRTVFGVSLADTAVVYETAAFLMSWPYALRLFRCVNAGLRRSKA